MLGRFRNYEEPVCFDEGSMMSCPDAILRPRPETSPISAMELRRDGAHIIVIITFNIIVY